MAVGMWSNVLGQSNRTVQVIWNVLIGMHAQHKCKCGAKLAMHVQCSALGQGDVYSWAQNTATAH